MEAEKSKLEESSLGEELYGDKDTAPNTFAQPSIGVQAAIVKRLIDTQDE